MEALEVDGSHGEGGGQILRTAAAFSVILRRPVRVTRIRAGRKVPGLRPQHAAALRIIRDVSGGRLEGAEVGSTEISFTPGKPASSNVVVDMKTAASITLAMLGAIPAASLSGSRLNLELIGGTDVPWSPPFDYLATVVKEGYRRLGIEFVAESSKRGYYPVGGGRVKATIEPCPKVKSLDMATLSHPSRVNVLSRCGRLPRHVAERQSSAALELLERAKLSVGKVVATEEAADSPGSSVVLWSVEEGLVAGTDAIGAKGLRAEAVGEAAATKFIELVRTGACVDSALADMLAPLLCLAQDESRLRIPEPTTHLTTNLHVASLFTGCRYDLRPEGPSTLLTVTPNST